MIEERPTSVALESDRNREVKGAAAEEYPCSCADISGLSENIRQTVTRKSGELSDPYSMVIES